MEEIQSERWQINLTAIPNHGMIFADLLARSDLERESEIKSAGK